MVHDNRGRTTFRQGPQRMTDLLGGQEQLLSLGNLLCKLLAASDLPDVREVFALVVVVGGFTGISVFEALRRLWDLDLWRTDLIHVL